MLIFLLTHHPPSIAPKQNGRLTFTFVGDGVESAVARAKATARDKAVQVVGGVSIAQQLLDAGRVDELHVDIMPVFLGTGFRSFESAIALRPFWTVQFMDTRTPRDVGTARSGRRVRITARSSSISAGRLRGPTPIWNFPRESGLS